jgi:hypothetical protein
MSFDCSPHASRSRDRCNASRERCKLLQLGATSRTGKHCANKARRAVRKARTIAAQLDAEFARFQCFSMPSRVCNHRGEKLNPIKSSDTPQESLKDFPLALLAKQAKAFNADSYDTQSIRPRWSATVLCELSCKRSLVSNGSFFSSSGKNGSRCLAQPVKPPKTKEEKK